MDTNKQNARRWFEEVFSSGNLELIPELIASEYVNHDPNVPEGVWAGLEGAQGLVSTYRSAFPDLKFTITHQIAEGDLVMTRWSATGTHQGPLGTLPATHKSATITGTNLKRFMDGKAVEEWANFDMMGLLQQLGAVPKQG